MLLNLILIEMATSRGMANSEETDPDRELNPTTTTSEAGTNTKTNRVEGTDSKTLRSRRESARRLPIDIKSKREAAGFRMRTSTRTSRKSKTSEGKCNPILSISDLAAQTRRLSPRRGAWAGRKKETTPSPRKMRFGIRTRRKMMLSRSRSLSTRVSSSRRRDSLMKLRIKEASIARTKMTGAKGKTITIEEDPISTEGTSKAISDRVLRGSMEATSSTSSDDSMESIRERRGSSSMKTTMPTRPKGSASFVARRDT